jgi:hypothetical protein
MRGEGDVAVVFVGGVVIDGYPDGHRYVLELLKIINNSLTGVAGV